MDHSQIDWHKDSQSFDAVAEIYDRYRPSYPTSVIDRILVATNISKEQPILEIGSGTGKATELFTQRGYSLLCIEPGDNLTKVAQKKLKAFPTVHFEKATFDDWEDKGRRFALVVSAQAFHWVSQEVRYQKAAHVLKENGYLALFWNQYPPLAMDLVKKLNQVYREFAPELAHDVSNSSAAYQEKIQFWVDDLEESGCFGQVEMTRYPWTASYNTQQYLGVLNTYSDHLRLSEERRQDLFAGIESLIEHEGGKIDRPYETILYLARRQP